MISQDELMQRAKKIRLMILDVDGVLTNGELYFSATGEALKVFHVLDGWGIKRLQDEGISIAIISGRQSEALTKRAQELNIEYVYQNISDKAVILEELIKLLNLTCEQVIAIGDDVPDLAVLTQTGLAVAVANAHDEVKNKVHWITKKKGGEGAVREICDLIIKSRL